MAQTPPPASALADALASVGDRWTLLVIAALLDGPRRSASSRPTCRGSRRTSSAPACGGSRSIAWSSPSPISSARRASSTKRPLQDASSRVSCDCWPGGGRVDEGTRTRHATGPAALRSRRGCGVPRASSRSTRTSPKSSTSPERSRRSGRGSARAGPGTLSRFRRASRLAAARIRPPPPGPDRTHRRQGEPRGRHDVGER